MESVFINYDTNNEVKNAGLCISDYIGITDPKLYIPLGLATVQETSMHGGAPIEPDDEWIYNIETIEPEFHFSNMRDNNVGSDEPNAPARKRQYTRKHNIGSRTVKKRRSDAKGK